jgi:hypothetical protein
LERTKNNSNLPQATSQTDSNNEYNVEGVQSLAQVQPSNHLIKKDTLTPALSQPCSDLVPSRKVKEENGLQTSYQVPSSWREIIKRKQDMKEAIAKEKVKR